MFLVGEGGLGGVLDPVLGEEGPVGRELGRALQRWQPHLTRHTAQGLLLPQPMSICTCKAGGKLVTRYEVRGDHSFSIPKINYSFDVKPGGYQPLPYRPIYSLTLQVNLGLK